MSNRLFECIREDGVKTKLWVKTPFPITHNVWGFFVKDIFPKFSMPEPQFSRLKQNDCILKNSAGRWDFREHKYLVREKNENGSYKSCIADGEDFRWTHADLPDDKRNGLEIHNWGLVYIPNEIQSRYLDSISELLTQNPEQMSDILSNINQLERDTMRGLLTKLKGILEKRPSSLEELRKESMGLYGDFPWMLANYQTRETLEIGKLPLTSKNPMNTIEGQTELDFYRNLDDLFRPEPEGFGNRSYVETGGIGWCMDCRYRQLTGRWIICPELNEKEKVDYIGKKLSDSGCFSR
jgi:hypothetical protein